MASTPPEDAGSTPKIPLHKKSMKATKTFTMHTHALKLANPLMARRRFEVPAYTAPEKLL